MKNLLPEALKERLERILGADEVATLESSERSRTRAVRVNSIKAEKDELVESLEERGFVLEKIPWANGFWIDNAESLDETVEYFLGHYYIMDAASMIPAVVLEPNEDDVTLDLTAAPGSKTTQIADLMENKGCLIANELDDRRRGVLKFNLSKYGVLNTVVTAMDAARTWECKIRFNRILLDAPCSCEGQIGNPEALKQWSMHKVKRCSEIQKRMIENAANLLADDGVLVYSTCTLAPEENEEVVDYVLQKDKTLEIEKISVRRLETMKGLAEWEGKKYSDKVEKTLRVVPTEKTEGFYIANFRKCSN